MPGSQRLFQGCKLFHRLQTHSILTAVVTGIECSTNRDLPAGRLAEPGDQPEENRQGVLLVSSPFKAFLPTPIYEIGCKTKSCGSFSPISFPVFASQPLPLDRISKTKLKLSFITRVFVDFEVGT
jgi:hypothetical protein